MEANNQLIIIENMRTGYVNAIKLANVRAAEATFASHDEKKTTEG